MQHCHKRPKQTLVPSQQKVVEIQNESTDSCILFRLYNELQNVSYNDKFLYASCWQLEKRFKINLTSHLKDFIHIIGI